MDKIFKPMEYDYINLQKSIHSLKERYSFLKEKSIGKSCAGRDITVLTLGKNEDYALFVSAFHGSEHISTNVLMMWFEELCEAVKTGGYICGINARKLIMNRGIMIIPRINPDGCEISIHGELGCGGHIKSIRKMCGGDYKHYNANLRGVDINHNFDADFLSLKKREEKMGIIAPCSTRFGGYSAESEPETKALADLCRKVSIRHALALHTQGEVIYWSFGNNKPEKSKQMADILSKSSGYALDYASGISSGGGFKDWFISYFNRPAFTVELGNGKNPLPISDAFNITERVKEMLTVASFL